MDHPAPVPAVTLYDWRPSPFCMKVRAILHHKGVAWRREHALEHVWRIGSRGGVGKVPAIEVDGEFLVDSTDIVHALERRFPDRPVIPSAPRDRALCHALEDWADEALYFHGLYFHWHEPAGRVQVASVMRRSWMGFLLFWPFAARIERQLRGQGTGRKSPAHIRADVGHNLDAIDGLLEGRDFLLGEGPFLCDFAVAAQLVYLSLAPAMRDVLTERPRTAAFVERMRAHAGKELTFAPRD